MELLVAAILAISFVYLSFRERGKVSEALKAGCDRYEQVLREELALAQERAKASDCIAEAEKAKRESLESQVKKQVKSLVESHALPYFGRTEKDEFQFEEELKRPSPQEYNDEVAGLGR